jgi:glycosyltransferase involved in cell wall biosynthesis
MKVVIINTHVKDFLGGSETQCNLIAEQLTNNNITVIYYAIDGSIDNMYTSKYKIINTSLNFRNIYTNLKIDKPDIIYWRFGKTKLFNTILISKLLKVKFIFAVSGPSDYSILEKFNFTEKIFIKKILHFIYINYIVVLNIYNHIGFYLCDAVIYQLENQFNSIPCKSFYLIHNSFQDKTADFSWNHKYVVWVSNIKANKNPNYFIELAKEYINSGYDFLMVGKIQDRKFDYLLGEIHVLPKNFYYLGEKSSAETNSIIEKSAFLVHTCNPEGFPNVFIQAWNFGKPTVSLFYDPDSFIEKNKLGYFSKNYKTLVKDTGTLLKEDNLRNSIGENAILYSRSNFNITKNIHNLITVLNKTLHKN